MSLAFLSGFSTSRKQATRAGHAIAEYRGQQPSDMLALTLPEAMQDLVWLRAALRGRKVYSHSAGIIGANEAEMDSLQAFAPALPIAMHTLIRRGIDKPRRMVLGATTAEDRLVAHRLSLGSVGELLRHPYGHLSQIGRIASFDSAKYSLERTNFDIALAFMKHDEFGFVPSDEQIERLRRAGRTCLVLKGGHDQLLAEPQETMQAFDDALAA